MKLYAISDLHLRYSENRVALLALPKHASDWVIVAGDVGETHAHVEYALQVLTSKFDRILWVPGNHELWTVQQDSNSVCGQAKYEQLAALCRSYGAVTPDDPYVMWTGEGEPCVLAPLFLLYDYSFRPPQVPAARAVEWAIESGVLCTDEALLRPDPYSSVADWCAERCVITEQRLAQASERHPLVLINHFPLLADLAHLPKIPRFSIWCGTTRTHDWHTRFRAKVVVSGHLHLRSTHWRDGVRFEEVSLGYPNQWRQKRGVNYYLREILPGPPTPPPYSQ
jgi:predicted phosphodiesterase